MADRYPENSFGAESLDPTTTREEFVAGLVDGGSQFDNSSAIKVHPDYPDIIVRRERRFDGLNPELALGLFNELQDNYGVSVAQIKPLTHQDYKPSQELEDDPFLYWTVARIDGPSLYYAMRPNVPPEVTKQLFGNLTDYLVDKSQNRELFLDDIFKQRQWRYGTNRQTGDPTPKLWLVDASPLYTLDDPDPVHYNNYDGSGYTHQLAICAESLSSLMRTSERLTGMTYDTELSRLIETLPTMSRNDSEREMLTATVSSMPSRANYR
jgi:hypothetical protein